MMTRFARLGKSCASLLAGLRMDLKAGLTQRHAPKRARTRALLMALGLTTLGLSAQGVVSWGITGALPGALAAQEAGSEGSEEREGGIIGTGVTAYDLVGADVSQATGIYGTITALGSIYVNGNHIALDPTLVVRGSPVISTADALRPGHTVAVVVRRAELHDPAAPNADQPPWQAVDIRHVVPLVGPVGALGDGVMTVLGTVVRLPEAVAQMPDIGDWVAVSGLWRGDQVIASRLDLLIGRDHQARISGSYPGPDAKGGFTIGGSQITGITPEHLRRGMQLRLSGTPRSDGLQDGLQEGLLADRLEAGLFDAEVGLQHVEGYYSVPAPDGLYTVLGSGLVAYTDRPQMISTAQPVLRCGRQDALIRPDAELSELFEGC